MIKKQNVKGIVNVIFLIIVIFFLKNLTDLAVGSVLDFTSIELASYAPDIGYELQYVGLSYILFSVVLFYYFLNKSKKVATIYSVIGLSFIYVVFYALPMGFGKNLDALLVAYIPYAVVITYVVFRWIPRYYSK